LYKVLLIQTEAYTFISNTINTKYPEQTILKRVDKL
jgi:hypothetical protein